VRRLLSELAVPTVVALRERLDEICRHEMEAFREEAGPLSEEQELMLAGLSKRISSRIAGTLARELKDLPEKMDQDKLTAAIQKLFHLRQTPPAAAN